MRIDEHAVRVREQQRRPGFGFSVKALRILKTIIDYYIYIHAKVQKVVDDISLQPQTAEGCKVKVVDDSGNMWWQPTSATDLNLLTFLAGGLPAGFQGALEGSTG